MQSFIYEETNSNRDINVNKFRDDYYFGYKKHE